MNNYKLVEVIWEDAWSDTAQLEIDAVGDFKPIERKDVGYLIKSDKEGVIITPGLVKNLYAGKLFTDGIRVFPRSMVKKMRGIDGD